MCPMSRRLVGSNPIPFFELLHEDKGCPSVLLSTNSIIRLPTASKMSLWRHYIKTLQFVQPTLLEPEAANPANIQSQPSTSPRVLITWGNSMCGENNLRADAGRRWSFKRQLVTSLKIISQLQALTDSCDYPAFLTSGWVTAGLKCLTETLNPCNLPGPPHIPTPEPPPGNDKEG